jgi:hypothetical protein
MSSNVTQFTGLQVGTRDGNWVWNGSQWVCSPDCGTDGSCPPFGPPVFSGPVAQPPWYPGANGGVSFGASAPANPVRGHMWWDGTTFWLFDGAAWEPIGGAAPGTGPSPGPGPVGTTTKVFSITQASPIAGIGTWPALNIVPLTANPTIDTMTGWNATTKQFTPKKAGYYFFHTFQYMGASETVAGHALLFNDTGTYNATINDYIVYEAFSAATAPGLILQGINLRYFNGTTDFCRLYAGSSDAEFYTAGVGTLPILAGYAMP